MEYKRVGASDEAQLNRLGRQGWRIVPGIVFGATSYMNMVYVIMERPLPTEAVALGDS